MCEHMNGYWKQFYLMRTARFAGVSLMNLPRHWFLKQTQTGCNFFFRRNIQFLFDTSILCFWYFFELNLVSTRKPDSKCNQKLSKFKCRIQDIFQWNVIYSENSDSVLRDFCKFVVDVFKHLITFVKIWLSFRLSRRDCWIFKTINS